MGFTVNGLDEFSLSLKEAAELPNSVKDNMLKAGADVLVTALKKKNCSVRTDQDGQSIEFHSSVPKTSPWRNYL